MSALAAGLALALAASVALNGGFLLQHSGSAAAPPITPRRPLATLRGLLGSRVWALGLAAGLTGWALHVAALSRAPLSLVQAFTAGGLALTVPAARRWLRQPLSRREGAAVGAMAAALVVLALGAGGGVHAGGWSSLGAGGGADADGFSSVALGGYLAAAAALASGLAAAPGRARRAEALGLAGGVLYGAADTAIKVLTGVASSSGLAAAAASPWLGAALVLTAGAFFAFQRGLQLGRAVPVIALMTAGTYVVSIFAGVLVLGDPLGAGAAAVALHAGALAAVVASAWVLAPSQAAFAAAQAAGGREASAGSRA